MLIKIVGKRSFQVDRADVKSPCREVNDSFSKKVGYLDPTFDYEVDDVVANELLRRYPMDIASQAKVNTFVAPVAKEAEKGKKKKA